jgi:hypothetical protein
MEHIQAKQRYSERDAAEIARALVATVAYCHQNGEGLGCARAPDVPCRVSRHLDGCRAPSPRGHSRRLTTPSRARFWGWALP